MKKKSRLILILGDQLNLESAVFQGFDAKFDTILMVESNDEANYVWTHKAKIALFLSAMRHFAQELRALKYPLIYIEQSARTIAEHLREELQKKSYAQLVCVLPGEWRLGNTLVQVAQECGVSLEVCEDQHFYCSPEAFRDWVADKKELRLEYFYRLMRKTHNILMDKQGNPEGGQWNFDQDNRKPYPKKGPGVIDAKLSFTPDKLTRATLDEVNVRFADHPGSLEHFQWPVTRVQALQLLEHFVKHRLRNFGDYQDAMWTDTPFGWHSMLSSSLNLKLLNPREVIAAVLVAWKKENLEIAAVEGFIRQILGWREFVRGMYYLDMPKMAEDNFFSHTRKLPQWYWTGQTDMNCMRDTVGQTLNYGYAHHIQRLMITGNFALLAEILPSEVSAWYLAVYVDAIEWVELPNTAGMALYANGGRFTSKPYIASGAYVKRMSNYCQSCKYKPEVRFGPTACPFTTLYWNFLIKHRSDFERNPRTRLMTANLNRISLEDQSEIFQHAQQMLNHLDTL